jgi:DNA-3-methyladenine glycosylase
MAIPEIISLSFYDRPTVDVARSLLGKFLVREIDGERIEGMITETEAYDGFEDKASHASRGITERNKPMFGPAGHWYVYLVYGMHWMLNVVTGKEKYPAAVLIRGIKGVSGPARLTKYFKIGKSFNSLSVSEESGLWIEDRGSRYS